MSAKQRDNATLPRKVELRRRAMRALTAAAVPTVVLETHGGLGRIGDACYRDVEEGIVFERDPEKAGLLARKRPTWAVYEGDCEAALAAGVGAHLAVTLLDLDPYGDPWPALEAYFGSPRPRAPRLEVVVNDGLRQAVKCGIAWRVESLRAIVQRRGNDLHADYLEVCRELLAESGARAGYRVAAWAGYYCGARQNMTHYWATLLLGEELAEEGATDAG